MDYQITIKSDENNEQIRMECLQEGKVIRETVVPITNLQNIEKKVRELISTTNKHRYGFNTMKVGDVKIVKSCDSRKVQNAAWITSGRKGWAMRTQTLTNNKVKVTRVA
jgi:hypothetical protein